LLGRAPKIFNTDEGVQFTNRLFTDRLERDGILVSMDGRGRALDNILIERLWRTVKYEEVYLKDYRCPLEVRESLGRYFDFYNQQRLHQSLDVHLQRCMRSSERANYVSPPHGEGRHQHERESLT